MPNPFISASSGNQILSGCMTTLERLSKSSVFHTRRSSRQSCITITPNRVTNKGKNGKGQYICNAPYCRQPTSKALRYGYALSRDLTVLPAHPRVYPRTECTIPAFAFPAEAGTHLPTQKGWKAELAWATRTVSKQSAQDCYTMFIAAANRSKHHASLGKQVCAAC